MAFNNTTGSPGHWERHDLVSPAILGGESLSKGLFNMVEKNQQTVQFSRFFAAKNQLQAVVAMPDTAQASDTFSKDLVEVETGKFMFYDEIDPITAFEDDWEAYWSSGRYTEAQINSKIKSKIQEQGILSVADNIEKLIWRGDTAGAAHLAFSDGLEKKIEADGTVNVVTPAGAITKANVIDILEAVLNAMPAEVRQKKNIKFIVPYHVLYAYYDAGRDTAISKGWNIDQLGVVRFAGIELVPVNGISDNKIVLSHFGTGVQDNFRFTTWVNADYKSFKIDRKLANGDLWFIKTQARTGVGYMFGEEISYYKSV